MFVSLPSLIGPVFGSCGFSGSFGFSGSLAEMCAYIEFSLIFYGVKTLIVTILLNIITFNVVFGFVWVWIANG